MEDVGRDTFSRYMAHMLGVKVALTAKIVKTWIMATNLTIPRPY